MSWAETGHSAGGAGSLGAAGRKAGKNLAPGSHCKARARPGEALGRQVRGHQSLFSSQSLVCAGHWEAEGGPTDLRVEKALGLQRLPVAGQELSPKSLLVVRPKAGLSTQPGGRGRAGSGEATTREAEAWPLQANGRQAWPWRGPLEVPCCAWGGRWEPGTGPGVADFRTMWGPAEVAGTPKLGLEEPPGGSLQAWRLRWSAGAKPPRDATMRPELGLESLA